MPKRQMAVIFLAAILVAGTSAAQDAALRWIEFHPPVYPRIAQLAHVQGQVIIGVDWSSGGTITAQSEGGGHPMLAEAALASLQHSKLACDSCKDELHHFRIVYEFTMPAGPCQDDAAWTSTATVHPDAADHITITTTNICPIIDSNTYTKRKARSIRCLYLWRCAFRQDR